jgi:integration host factor subunit beta
MTRAELIQIVSSKQSQLSEKNTEKIVKDIFNQMAEALGTGHRIEIRGFGSFSIRYHAARMTRNPKTGEGVSKAGKYSVHFKAGKDMRDRVNQSWHNPVQHDGVRESV